ncbi:MAG: STAS domain-containing protein [Candidatus Eisenbacteria bacterium]|jgi:anti-sigma B factor antagonist|nr:STAS domain-containing protein [Candidatus Eisenbacteria bacterium]
MLELQVQDGGAVRLIGRLDAAEAGQLQMALDAIPGPVTLECSALDYISSAGISVILLTHRRVTAAGSTLTLVGLNPRVRSVFTLANLDKVFVIQ